MKKLLSILVMAMLAAVVMMCLAMGQEEGRTVSLWTPSTTSRNFWKARARTPGMRVVRKRPRAMVLRLREIPMAASNGFLSREIATRPLHRQKICLAST